MKLLSYGKEGFDGAGSCWLILGEDLGNRDLFRVELDKMTVPYFCLHAQIGGDCLFSASFALGKISGGITVWGY